MQDVFDELYRKGKESINVKDMMKIITSTDNIILAYRNIKTNSGSLTKGIDGKNIKALTKFSSEALVTHIRNKLNNFHPQAVRRVMIPKDNGNERPLGIPTITDRLVQQCILQVMEPFCEAKFHPHSYGFRPNRSTKHAVARANFLASINKLHHVVDVDIKGFFDNIDHGKLLKQIWSLGIKDKRLIAIISKMLKAEIANEGIPTKGAPQGGILSPLLANIALNEFDHWIDSQWENFPTSFQYANRDKRLSAMKRDIRVNSMQLKEVFIVRYADDFKLFCRSRKSAIKMLESSKQWLQDRLKLQVCEEKTKIVNLRKNYSEFLGIKLKVRYRRKIGVVKNAVGRWVTTSKVSDKALKRIKDKIKVKIKTIQKSDGKDQMKQIDKLNAMILGQHLYYKMATGVNRDFNKLSYQMRTKMHNRLNPRRLTLNEHRNIPNWIRKYYGNYKNQYRFLNTRVIVPLTGVTHFSPMNFNQKSQFVKEDRRKIHANLSDENVSRNIRYLVANPVLNRSVEYNDNRISKYSAQSGRCGITNELLAINEIECHHIKPIYLGGNDKYNNLIIVSKTVHKLIHATTTETIDKYMGLITHANMDKEKLAKFRQLCNLKPL